MRKCYTCRMDLEPGTGFMVDIGEYICSECRIRAVSENRSIEDLKPAMWRKVHEQRTGPGIKKDYTKNLRGAYSEGSCTVHVYENDLGWRIDISGRTLSGAHKQDLMDLFGALNAALCPPGKADSSGVLSFLGLESP